MKKVVSILTTFILITSFCVHIKAATSRSQLNSDLNDIQSQIDETATELKGVKADKSKTLLDVEALTVQISKYQDEINKMAGEISDLESNISEQEEKLEIAEANFIRQEKAFQQRVVARYEAGNTSYLDLLMKSSNLIDFLSNHYLVETIAEYDQKLLDNIEKEKREIQAIKEGLDKQKSDLEIAKKSKLSTQNALNNSKSVKNKYIGELSEKEKELQADLEQFEKDKKEIEAEIRRLTANSSNPIYVGGIMAWPVPGYYKISCEFHGYSGHSGMDITGNSPGSISGAPAVAANDGVVIISTDLYGNGNGGYRSYGRYVVIDHGGGVTTLYAHLSSRSVAAGQKVVKGQTIGLVGNTGNSTGAHLHFEVRINGSAVNPRNYVT